MLIKDRHLIGDECQLIFLKGMIKLNKIQLLMQYFIQAKHISGCRKHLQTIVGKENRHHLKHYLPNHLLIIFTQLPFKWRDFQDTTNQVL